MALLTENEVKRLMIATTSQTVGNSIADAINLGSVASAASSHTVKALIVATNVSQTVDFGALLVADKILVIAAAAGNAHFVTCAVAGDLGEAAVVGSLYVVLRANTAPTASAVKF